MASAASFPSSCSDPSTFKVCLPILNYFFLLLRFFSSFDFLPCAGGFGKKKNSHTHTHTPFIFESPFECRLHLARDQAPPYSPWDPGCSDRGARIARNPVQRGGGLGATHAWGAGQPSLLRHQDWLSETLPLVFSCCCSWLSGLFSVSGLENSERDY